MSKILFKGYASILRLVLDKPRDHMEIAAKVACGSDYVRYLMRCMWALRLVHVKAWLPSSYGFARPVYSFGPGEDAAGPSAANGAPHPGVQRPKRLQLELVAFAHFARALEDACSVEAAQEAAGLDQGTAYRLMNHMHALRLVHIADWERRSGIGGTPTRLFRLAPNHADKPRPPRELNRTTVSRYIKKRKARDQQLRMLHALAANGSIFNQQQQA
jgi:hypothetical protein